MMRHNPVKERMLNGETTVGTMVWEFNSSGIAQLAANAGAEWVLYDMEHTGWSTSDIRASLAAARASGIVPVVRPPFLQYHLVSGPLDVGAMGIMAPMIESAEQAKSLVQACRYPPVGIRGAAFGVVHDDFTVKSIDDTIASVNSEVLVIAMIESALGVENVDDIAAVDGLDALWVGPLDLSSFLGIPGKYDHPDFLAAIEKITSAAKRHGKPVGVVVGSVDDARNRKAQGFTTFLYGVDTGIYQGALANGISGLREMLDGSD